MKTNSTGNLIQLELIIIVFQIIVTSFYVLGERVGQSISAANPCANVGFTPCFSGAIEQNLIQFLGICLGLITLFIMVKKTKIKRKFTIILLSLLTFFAYLFISTLNSSLFSIYVLHLVLPTSVFVYFTIFQGLRQNQR